MSRMESELSHRQRLVVIAAAALGALLVGLLLAPTVSGIVSGDGTADEIPDEAVAVVAVDGQVNQQLAAELERELRDVRANDSVEAAVVSIETPGGAPAASERMYNAIQQTSEQMPIVASVGDISASGGYYAMLGADDIYVYPSSEVGSVGVNVLVPPEQLPPVEGPTGPDKVGSNVIEDWADIELIAETFIESVMEERGEQIELSRDEVATADTFLGVEAVENGFADDIGSLERAIEDVAQRAGLDEYAVVERDLTPDGPLLPVLVRTGDGLVAVHDEDPGFTDVEPVRVAMIYEPAVPHYETIQTIIDDEATTSEDGIGGDRS